MSRYARDHELRTKQEDNEEVLYGASAVSEELWLQSLMKKLVNKQQKRELEFPLKRYTSINRWIAKNKTALGWQSDYWDERMQNAGGSHVYNRTVGTRD